MGGPDAFQSGGVPCRETLPNVAGGLGLMGVLAKSAPPSAAYEPTGHEQTRGYRSNTTAQVTQLIGVRFLAYRTQGEPWATAKNGPTQTKTE